MQRLTLTIFTVLMLGPQAASAADVANGATLAKRWCASCHVVSRDQSRASADVPPFHEIAARPGFDETKASAFLRDPHPKMPGMNLTRAETADLAGYIASQK